MHYRAVACDFFEKLSYVKVYFGGVTMDTLKELNLEVTPDNEKIVRENLRKEFGMGAFAIKLLPKIKSFAVDNNVVSIVRSYSPPPQNAVVVSTSESPNNIYIW